jgi:hypothetical protein
MKAKVTILKSKSKITSHYKIDKYQIFFFTFENTSTQGMRMSLADLSEGCQEVRAAANLFLMVG